MQGVYRHPPPPPFVPVGLTPAEVDSIGGGSPPPDEIYPAGYCLFTVNPAATHLRVKRGFWWGERRLSAAIAAVLAGRPGGPLIALEGTVGSTGAMLVVATDEPIVAV